MPKRKIRDDVDDADDADDDADDDAKIERPYRCKYRGVSRSKSGKRFRVSIYIGGKKQPLGNFGSAVEAAKAYDHVAQQEGRVSE